jgi:hypothetical protein
MFPKQTFLCAVLLGGLGCQIPLALANEAQPSQSNVTSRNQNISVPPFLGQLSHDTTPVVIHTPQFTLRVPRNYLESLDASGPTFFIRIVASFPGFRAVDDINSSDFFNIYSSHLTRVITAATEVTISSVYEDWDKPAIDMVRKESPLMYGLTVVQAPLHDQQYYVHLATSKADHLFVIKCWPVLDTITCRVAVEIEPGLVVDYAYDRSLLPQWQTIDIGMRRLLESFVEK